jgi:hypothetical protein
MVASGVLPTVTRAVLAPPVLLRQRAAYRRLADAGVR